MRNFAKGNRDLFKEIEATLEGLTETLPQRVRDSLREHGLLGSDTNFAAVQALHPTGEPKDQRISALTPKTHAKAQQQPIVLIWKWN